MHALNKYSQLIRNDEGMSTIEYSIVKLLYPRRCETTQAVRTYGCLNPP